MQVAKKDKERGSEARTPEVIIEVARQIAREKGFAGVSTRQVAAQLGVTPTALYHHFSNKMSILDRLAETIVQEVVPTPPQEFWQERLRSFVLQIQQKMLEYPGLNSHLVHNTACPAALQWTDSILGILSDAGFAGEPLWRAFAMLMFFVNPRTLVEGQTDSGELYRRDQLTEAISEHPDRYPVLARALQMRQGLHFDAYYEIALDGIIAGLEVELQAYNASTQQIPVE